MGIVTDLGGKKIWARPDGRSWQRELVWTFVFIVMLGSLLVLADRAWSVA